MGIFQRIRDRVTYAADMDAAVSAFAAEIAPTFAVDADAIDPAVFGLTSYASSTAPAPRVDRRSAMQVPAVKRVRDLIAGTLGGLPVELFGPDQIKRTSALFEQPEPDVPRSVTLARTFEDLLFEGVAWWRVLEYGWHGFPVKVRRLDPRTVTVQQNGRVYVRADGSTQGVATEWIPDADLIRFDSPADGLLIAGARAIRTCLQLEAAAARYAEEPMPSGYFSPAEGADPAEDEDVLEILTAWQAARQARATGYVPAALKYNPVQFNPKDLQLAEARQHAVLEIARIAGVDADELSVAVTSRTYSNQFDRRKAFVDFTLGQYRQAFEDRLSMPDVTPRGFYARVYLDAFLRSDPASRYAAYKAGIEVGALLPEEIRPLEDKPAASTPPPTPEETPVAPAASVRALPALAQGGPVRGALRFEALVPEIRLDAPGATTFSVDAGKREIRGLAVPYGKVASSNGRKWQFAQGTLKWSDVSRVKLWIGHDQNRAVGVATALEDTPEGLIPTFKVARGAAGDEALQMAEDGVWDGLSIGIAPGGTYKRVGDVFHAVEAPLMEVSLTPAPAFDDARVHSVAASAAERKETAMPCAKCGKIHAPGVAECAAEFSATPPAAPAAPADPAPAADFSAITDAITVAFENLANPQGIPPREVIPAGGQFEVNEPSPYRFDGLAGSHSFAQDFRDAAFGNGDAQQRLETFMDAAFAVTTGNTTALNPVQNRPDLFVPNLTFTRPLWEMVTNGVVNDVTPFTIPKFASAGSLVGPHTQGTEPTPGSFTATNQTVTPTPISGKIEINREVWDQGGNPKTDAIIWGEMQNAYFEAIEARIATLLNGLTLTEINLASAVDEALVDALQNILVDLQYVRGGNRFTGFASDGLLFKAMVNASDTTGRKLLPVLSPSNAQGGVAAAFDRVQIGTLAARAAWALGATNASNSYLFVPSSVYAWASAPKRFTFEHQVKSVDMGIWGYGAEACLRDSDVKRIDYTTADA